MHNLTEHQKGLLGVFVAAILWSSGGLLIKLVTLTPMQISFFRCGIAALTFLVIFRSSIFKINLFTFINAFFYAAVLICYVIAMKMTTAANAIFLQSTAPIYVLIFEPLINKTKFDKSNVITITICILGMFLFFLGDLTPGQLEGNIFGLLAGIFFAAFFIGMRKNGKQYQQGSIFFGNILVTLICIPFALQIKMLTFSNLWMVTFLGVFQIAVAYAFFTFGLKRVYAVEASIISMFEPVLNPVWVFIGYGEVPSTYALIGGLIIIAAITIRTFYMGKTALRKSRFGS